MKMKLSGARRRVRAGAAAAGLVAAVTVLAACSSSGSSATATAAGKTSCPVRILLVTALTGAASQNGQSTLAGVKLAVKDVNAAGGVLGCPIQLTVKDDASNYAQDLPIVEQATSSTSYALVMPETFGAPSVAPYLNRQGLLTIASVGGTTFTEPNEPYPMIFDMGFLPELPIDVGVQYALSKGYTKIAAIFDNSYYGQSELAGLKSFLQGKDATLVNSESVSESSIDFTSAIIRARASDPDVLLVDLFGTAAAHLQQDLAAAAWNVPVIGGESVNATAYQGLVPLADLKNMTSVGAAVMAQTADPTVAKFISQLNQAGVKINAFMLGYASPYDAVKMFTWAAEQTKSVESKIIAAKLHDSGNVTIPGLVGVTTTNYTPTSGQWRPVNGLSIMKGGYFVNGQLPLIKTAITPKQ
jgi:branched-chain amino acid transport system substrate-binding protein